MNSINLTNLINYKTVRDIKWIHEFVLKQYWQKRNHSETIFKFAWTIDGTFIAEATNTPTLFQ